MTGDIDIEYMVEDTCCKIEQMPGAPIDWPERLVPPPRETTGTPMLAGDRDRRRDVLGAAREGDERAARRAYMLASAAYRWRV